MKACTNSSFFFFQAEDGIRDVAVTGVQTCALPICAGRGSGTGGHGEPSEEEIFGILSALTSFGHVGTGQGGVAAAGGVPGEKAQIPGPAPEKLKQTLPNPAGPTPKPQPDEARVLQPPRNPANPFPPA